MLTGQLDEKTMCGINILLLTASAQDQRRRLIQYREQWAWPPEWLCTRIQIKTSTPDIENFYWASSEKEQTKPHHILQQLNPAGCRALKASYSFSSKHPV